MAWNASVGATGYRLHYGTSSGAYTTTIDVGDVTLRELSSLVDCTRHYFALTAYGPGGESGYSAEVATLPRPIIASTTPSIVQRGQELSVLVDGANFDLGAVVEVYGAGLTVGEVTIDSCNRLSFELSVSATAAVGPATIAVRNPSGARGTASESFAVAEGNPPAVGSTEPIDGAVAVALAVQPSVHFSRPVSGASVSPSTLRLLDEAGQPIAQAAGSPFLSDDGMRATIVPASPLEPGRTYRVQVVGGPTGVVGLDGLPLDPTFAQPTGFTTVAPLTPPPPPDGLDVN